MPKSGQYVGKERAGDDIGEGEVAKSGRWWSYPWWWGHWQERTKCGEWRSANGSRELCSHRRGHRGEHRFQEAPPELLKRRTPLGGRRRESLREREAADYRDYLESQHQAAGRATKGLMVSKEGQRRGVTEYDFFKPHGRASTKWATEELRDWFAEHGRPFSASEYRAQVRDDEARRVHPYDTWS